MSATAPAEIDLKIVYDGPSGAGKTANLRQIAAGLDESFKGALLTLGEPAHPERTMLMDVLPVSFDVGDRARVRLRIYSTAGGAPHRAARRLVREGADAVVFVVEARAAAAAAANRAWAEMRADVGLRLADAGASPVPVVVQWNRAGEAGPATPAPEAVPGAERVVGACAAVGEGVISTLFAALGEAAARSDAATAALGPDAVAIVLRALQRGCVLAPGERACE